MTNKCSFCNSKLTRYGNIKLTDGILCRKCSSLKSQWLTSDDCILMDTNKMKKHLDYRNDNQIKISQFKHTNKVDGKYKLFVDDINKLFVISKKDNYIDDNADLFKAEKVKKISILKIPYEDSEYVNVVLRIEIDNVYVSKVEFIVNEFEAIEKDSEVYKSTLDKSLVYFDALLSICNHLKREE